MSTESAPAPPPAGDGLRHRALRGAAWSILNQAGTQLISVAVWVVLGRTLEPAEFGLVALAQLVIAFLLVFLEQGFAEALVQRKEMTREDQNTAFWSVLGMGLVLAALTNLAAAPVAAWKQAPALEPMLRALSLGFPLISLRTVPEALLIRGMRMKALAARSFAATTLAGLTGVSLALAGAGAWSLVGQALMTSAAGAGLLWWLSGWRPGWGWSRTSFRSLVGFGGHITGFNLLAYGNRRLDQWLVEHFHGAAILGYYQMAQRWVEVQAALIGQGLNQVSLASFARVQHDPERLARGYAQALRLAATIAAPLLTGLAALAPDVLRVLVGERWVSAAPMLSWLAVGAVIQSLNGVNAGVMLAMGKPGWRTGVNALNLALNATLFVLAAPYGPVWMTAAYAGRAWLIAPVQGALVHRLIRPRWGDVLGGVAGPLLAAAAAGFAARALGHALPDWVAFPRLVVSGLAGAALYLGLLAAVAPGALHAVLAARGALRAQPAPPVRPAQNEK
jgi:PST family polysaccharide transporter